MNFDWLLQYFDSVGYVGIFGILFLCGLGLPIPEDITIIASGYLVYLERFQFNYALLVCLSGVLLGDLTIYSIGRFGGRRIAKKWLFPRFFTPERLTKAEKFYKLYGGKTVFISRFLPGLRAASYFTAGMVRMNVLKFFILDAIAALISVPLILYASYYFGEEIDQGIRYITTTKYALLAIIAVGGIVLFVRYYRKAKKQKLNPPLK